jgi:[glutamine synthetase] adenylyltransferase / [glutamine synthetase]-adenylyl-L-tyrosine phosphorylase
MSIDRQNPIAWSKPAIELQPLDEAQADELQKEVLLKLQAAGLSELSDALQSHPDFLSFIGSVCTLSTFLRDCIMARPERLQAILARDPEDSYKEIINEINILSKNSGNESEFMAALREAKAKLALLCGFADLGQWWRGERVTAALSAFADAALGGTLDFLLGALHQSGKVTLPDPENPQKDSGLFILGMGKYGAEELNYSSDIDIILFFEQAKMQINSDDPISLFVRLTKSLIRIFQERTGHGYVFRVDLRLRPDPGSTPLVMPAVTALHYYEAYGQNWERAAMIKARIVAGDKKAGKDFLEELAPFVWRKYLDYAAISDVHSIKRQIHAHKGHSAIAVAGHNIKLGRGGIREVEFFAQTQQLIAGGRLPQLRKLKTLDALAALCSEGWIDEKARDELGAAYWYLRDVEHRIQMVADEQRHTLPEDDEGLARIAFMMGETDMASFTKRLTSTLKTVEKHYAGLFETSPQLSGEVGNLVFTGEDDDPETLETLSVMGFSRPSEVIRTVRAWHYGRFPAIRSAQARELLTELTPGLLQAVAATGQADETLAAFDRFVAGLPAGIQLFSLLKSNPELLRLLLLVLSSAPRLAEIITRKPHVFDGFLEPAFAGTVPDRTALAERLSSTLARTDQYEAVLDLARIFSAEQKFLIGMRLIAQNLSPGRAGRAYSNLAEILIDAMLNRLESEFEKRHGKIPGGRICVLGMGRLGSRELTAGSDLDLILLYDHPADAEFSDGEKPLAVSQYYIRLTQRLIAAMSAPTAEGVIFELDFRLRPSGNAGPLATPVEQFMKYQRKEAWIWEKQALTRARPVAGDAGLAEEIEQEICTLLRKPLPARKLAFELKKMRKLIDGEKPAKNIFDVKTARGGLIDIEFLAQWAILRNGIENAKHARPVSTMDQIEYAKQLFSQADYETLLEAWYAYNRLLQILRVCIETTYTPESAPGGLNEILCMAFDLPQVSAVEAYLADLQQKVRAIFEQSIK